MSKVTVSPVTDPREHPEDHRSHHPKAGSKQFINPWPSWGGMQPPLKFVQARFQGKISTQDVPRDIREQVAWRKTDFTRPASAVDTISVAWLGHASIFLEFPSAQQPGRGLRVLCDPVFSQRCSPMQWMGPKRYTPCTTSVSEVPHIDAVLLSHNHYDHLDHDTVLGLAKRFPELHFFVPLGVKAWFTAANVQGSRVTELDWWHEVTFTKEVDGREEGLRIGYLPAQHFTGRSISDSGETLWGSYSIESSTTSARGKRVWFGGDTGRRTIPQALETRLLSKDAGVRGEAEVERKALPVCPAHAQIGTLRGPFALAIIPIGAYQPRYLMSPVHVDPLEAIDIYREINATRALGIHWGTFSLSAEAVLGPKQELERLTKEANITGFECWGMGEMMYI